MARRLGEAFVSIEADASLFRASATIGVKKALAGVIGKIPITADTVEAVSQINGLKARMLTLNRQLAEIKIGANGKPAEAAIRKLQLQLKTLADTLATISMEADTSRLDLAIKKEEGNLAKLNAKASGLTLDADEKKLAVKIAAAEAGLERLNEQGSHLVIDADSKKMLSQIADMERQAFHLRAALGDPDAIRLEVDERAMEAKLASLDANVLVLQEHMTGMVMDADDRLLLRKIYAAEAELRALKALGDVPLIADSVALDAAIAASMAKIEALKAEAADLKFGGKTDLAALAATEGALLGLEDAAKRLNPEIGVTATKLIQGARGFGRFGLGALAARVALFGGLSVVTGWHLALDTIVESLAVIVPALVTAAAGLAAFGIAGVDAARAVYNRLLNIHTVSDALNQTIPPMTGHLEALHEVVRPQVWQLYGDAIAVAHTKTGLFEQLAVRTGGVVDNLAARLTVLATTSGTGLDKFLASGSRDLAEFGRIFLSLGDAFGKLIQVTEQTHIAEILLNVVGAAAKMFDIFTKIPLPILATVIALHGIYLWSGLAASGIIALLRPLGRLAASAAGAKLAGSAVKDLAAAGNDSRFARLGATFKDLGTNLKAIPGRVVSLGKALVGLFTNPWTWVAIGAVALVGLAVALYRSKSATDRFIDSINTMVSHSSDFTIINTLGQGLVQTNTKLASANSQVAAGLKAMRDRMHSASAEAVQYGSNQNQVVNSSRELTAEHAKLVGQLTLVTGRLSFVTKAFGTDGLAGAIALAHLAGVSTDEWLSKDTKVWAAAVQKIAGVVQGYANMGVGASSLGNAINVLTIAQSDQLKNMQSLNTAFDQFTKIVSAPVSGFLTFANTLKRFGNDAGVAGAQMSGLGSGMTKISKKVTDASLQLQTDFQDTFNAATQMADAMRLTGVASDKQVQAIKNVVQVMIPMAGSNKAAAAEISSLAQEAGGPATTNLKKLGDWAGKTKDPLGKVQKAASDAAIAFFDMSRDAQKLGTTLSQDLSKDMATAVENAIGLQGAMDKFAKDLQKGTDVTAAGHKDRKVLYDDLVQVTGSGKQADSVIAAISDRLKKNADTLSATDAARKRYQGDVNEIIKQVPTAKGDLDKFTNSVLDQKTKTDAGRSARSKLIADLRQSGVEGKTAKRLVDDLQTSIDRMHGKSVNVNVSGSGSGGIKITADGLAAAGQGNIRFVSGNFAAGGLVSRGSGPTSDDVPAMLSRGEVVVPTHMVKAGAVDHLRGALPGFKSGGIAGMSASLPTVPGRVAAFAVKDAATALLADVKHAIKAVKSLMGGSGASILAYAEQFRGKSPYVWGGSTPSGWDCSGFVSYVYKHFKLLGARMDAQGLQDWSKPSTPTPGGMAFYGRPAHHVGFVVNGHTLLSALGRKWGTIESPLNMGDNSGYGIPPQGFGKGSSGPGSQSAIQELAFAMLQNRGWGVQWPAFNSLEVREAGWRLNARNPSSGAYGLAQFINGPSEYFQYGGNPNTAQGQLTGMMNYIAQRYGDPNAAWAHEIAAGWYAKGGLVGGGVRGYAGGGSPTFLDPSASRWLKSYTAAQKAEYKDYVGFTQAYRKDLKHPKSGSYAARHAKTLMSELGTLDKRQRSEDAGYDAILHMGVTPKTTGHLGSLIKSERTTMRDKTLAYTGKGGHPGWLSGMGHWLAQLSSLIGSPPAANILPAGAVTQHVPGSVKDIHLGPTHTVNGGVLKFDRGGRWPSGTLGVNTSGRTETVIPPGAGSTGGDIHLHLTVNGPVGSQAELEDWYVRTANKMARTGRLTQAVKTAGR